MQYFFEIITCDLSIYTMDHPDLNVSNFMGNSMGTKRDNTICHSITIFDTAVQVGIGLTLVLGYIYWDVIILWYLRYMISGSLINDQNRYSVI